jgi:hypothetical protein
MAGNEMKRTGRKSIWSKLGSMDLIPTYSTQRHEVWRAIFTTNRLIRENDRLIEAPGKLDFKDPDAEFAALVKRMHKYRSWGWL